MSFPSARCRRLSSWKLEAGSWELGQDLFGREKSGGEIDEPFTRQPGMEKLSLKTFDGMMVAIIIDFRDDGMNGRAFPRLPDQFQVGLEIIAGEPPAQSCHRQMPGRKTGQQHGFLKIFLPDSELKTANGAKCFHPSAHNLNINHYRRTVKGNLGHPIMQAAWFARPQRLTCPRVDGYQITPAQGAGSPIQGFGVFCSHGHAGGNGLGEPAG